MRSWKIYSCLLSLVLFGNIANAASFDCAKARSKLELLICNNPTLNDADTAMGIAYKNALNTFPVKGFVRSSQIAFLAGYKYCADDKNLNISLNNCLTQTYARTAQLQSFALAKVYYDATGAYDPSKTVLQIYNRDGKTFLSMFGSFMPDMNRPEPFPRGFICDEEFELRRVNGKLVPKDVDWKVDISETKIVADFYSCSPRNGVNGEFRRVN
jgi:uncharacterized protein